MFKETTDIAFVLLKAVYDLCISLNEVTHKTLNHFCQVESLDGICPAAFSGDFYSSLLCVYVCVESTILNLCSILHNLEKLNTTSNTG